MRSLCLQTTGLPHRWLSILVASSRKAAESGGGVIHSFVSTLRHRCIYVEPFIACSTYKPSMLYAFAMVVHSRKRRSRCVPLLQTDLVTVDQMECLGPLAIRKLLDESVMFKQQLIWTKVGKVGSDVSTCNVCLPKRAQSWSLSFFS